MRTWDKDGQVPPWSGWASFETGLRDEDWCGAAWIRRPPGNPDLSALSIVAGRGRVTGGDVTIARPGTDWADYVVTLEVTPVTRAAAVVSGPPTTATATCGSCTPPTTR